VGPSQAVRHRLAEIAVEIEAGRAKILGRSLGL
jgi:alkylation response protein AidB-like acyl-CoA dehydrogenase